ncbi:MAG: hypothetical protein FWD67_09915 [Betaproteobacteria bacterium]|nr:hypothetical protein [Betaproteobacteria bacterium]
MPIFSPLPENAAPGDHARRRGTLCLLSALVATPLTAWIFLNLQPFWLGVTSLDGAAFALVATLFGAILVVSPVISVAGWLLTLWYGVESVFMPRERRTPTADIVITGIGLVAWFLPTLGFLAAAVLTHKDPQGDHIVYWQGIGYKLIAAAVLAWLAWRYWRSKLHRKPDV